MAAIIGVVGGLGPEGTVHYYRKLTARLAAFPLAARPGLVVDHLWIDRFSALLRAEADVEALALLTGSLRRLHGAGADAALIAAVTPHRFLSPLRAVSPLPIVDLVAATRDDVRAAGHRAVGVLGTRVTLSEPFLTGELDRSGISVVVPDDAGISWLDALIFGPLARGEKTASMRRELGEIVSRMAARTRFDALVVACTDLMDLLDPALPLIDPIDSHVDRAVRMLAIGEPGEA